MALLNYDANNPRFLGTGAANPDWNPDQFKAAFNLGLNDGGFTQDLGRGGTGINESYADYRNDAVQGLLARGAAATPNASQQGYLSDLPTYLNPQQATEYYRQSGFTPEGQAADLGGSNWWKARGTDFSDPLSGGAGYWRDTQASGDTTDLKKAFVSANPGLFGDYTPRTQTNVGAGSFTQGAPIYAEKGWATDEEGSGFHTGGTYDWSNEGAEWIPDITGYERTWTPDAPTYNQRPGYDNDKFALRQGDAGEATSAFLQSHAFDLGEQGIDIADTPFAGLLGNLADTQYEGQGVPYDEGAVLDNLAALTPGATQPTPPAPNKPSVGPEVPTGGLLNPTVPQQYAPQVQTQQSGGFPVVNGIPQNYWEGNTLQRPPVNLGQSDFQPYQRGQSTGGPVNDVPGGPAVQPTVTPNVGSFAPNAAQQNIQDIVAPPNVSEHLDLGDIGGFGGLGDLGGLLGGSSGSGSGAEIGYPEGMEGSALLDLASALIPGGGLLKLASQIKRVGDANSGLSRAGALGMEDPSSREWGIAEGVSDLVPGFLGGKSLEQRYTETMGDPSSLIDPSFAGVPGGANLKQDPTTGALSKVAAPWVDPDGQSVEGLLDSLGFGDAIASATNTANPGLLSTPAFQAIIAGMSPQYTAGVSPGALNAAQQVQSFYGGGMGGRF